MNPIDLIGKGEINDILLVISACYGVLSWGSRARRERKPPPRARLEPLSRGPSGDATVRLEGANRVRLEGAKPKRRERARPRATRRPSGALRAR